MSARRALRLFADQDPLQPQTTTKHGSPAAQREQFLLADVLEGMEQAWQAHMAHGGNGKAPPGPARQAYNGWITQRRAKPPEIDHLVSLMARPTGAGGRGAQPPLVDAFGAVSVVEYLCKKKDTEEARAFLGAFRAAWGWVDAAEAAPVTAAAVSASREGHVAEVAPATAKRRMTGHGQETHDQGGHGDVRVPHLFHGARRRGQFPALVPAARGGL